MQGYNAAVMLFPQELQQVLSNVSPEIQACVQEIRLRVGQAVSLSFWGTEHYITPQGKITEDSGTGVMCTQTWL